MTFELLSEIIEKNNIPKNVSLISDSGWECCSTEMDGVYYNPKDNEIVFTQDGDEFESYHKDDKWKLLYSAKNGIEQPFTSKDNTPFDK